MQAHDIFINPIHLGIAATVKIEPQFTGTMDWYADYAKRHAGDGAEGRLVAMHSFEKSWDMWEMHPVGCELVLCISGTITLHQQIENGTVVSVTLRRGQYAVNSPGIWHTADVDQPTTALFITAGMGTQHRPR